MTKAITLEMIQAKAAASRAKIENARTVIEVETRRLADFEATTRVFVSLSEGVDEDLFTSESAFPGIVAVIPWPENPYKPRTNKACIWQALKELPEVWITANDLQAVASNIKGDEIPMSSISPCLTEMKADGHIARDGFKVALTARLNEIAALNGFTASAANAEGAATPSNQSPADQSDLLG